MMAGCVQPLPAAPMMTTVTSTIGKKRLFIRSSPCIFGSDAFGNSHAPVIMNVVPWNITKRRICSGWSGSGTSASMVRIPQTAPLLKRPSGTPFNGTAPAISGSALTLRRWNTGSGSLIVSRSRPRIWNSAVIRCEGVSTSTLVQAIVAPRTPAVCMAGRIARRTLRSPENGHVDLDEARRQIEARAELQAFISTSSEQGAGTVVAVKDLVDVAGMVTTAGGIILPNEPAAKDAPVVERIRREGCVVVGKTNLHEFAYGVT